tara:strand:- start:992 stop:1627 length:636 start_codon:yes stop_codon:yes gene_type:complete
MRGKRPRDQGLEKYVAQKQQRPLGLYNEEGLEEMMRLIDAKGGDYYKSDLHPNPQAGEAMDMMPYTARYTPLQEEIIEDMRRYYGLGAPQQRPVMDVATMPAQQQKEIKAIVDPPTKAQATKDKFVEEIIEQNPESIQEMAAEQLAADLNKSTANFEAEVNKMNAKDKNELALYLTALAAGGGGVAAMSSQNNEPQLTEEQLIALKQAGVI